MSSSKINQTKGQADTGAGECSADWREVSKEEWNAWVNEKGAEPLVNNCSEPPTLQAMLGGKVVAIAKLYDGSEYHGGRMPIYFLPNITDERHSAAKKNL